MLCVKNISVKKRHKKAKKKKQPPANPGEEGKNSFLELQHYQIQMSSFQQQQKIAKHTNKQVYSKNISCKRPDGRIYETKILKQLSKDAQRIKRCGESQENDV